MASEFDIGMVQGAWKPRRSEDGPEGAVGVLEREQPVAEQPRMYRLLMLNDDYTPMEFVVHVLCCLFRMPEPKAVELMLRIHNEGKGLVGVYTYEIAETKAAQVLCYARKHDHPLRCALEAEE